VADTWLTNWLKGNFSKSEVERIELTAKVAELEAIKALLEKDNESLRERLRNLELDDRDTRRGLLLRLGILSNPADSGAKREEPKPVKKTRVPWEQQAAKLEADSRERYWKKQIEDREKPQEQRKAEAEAKKSPEQQELQQDLEILNESDAKS